MNQQSPSWSRQFINAVCLGPSIDEDNFVVEDVTLWEAMVHFFSVGWNVLFAIVPPADYANGKACFVVSLCMIGFVTAIVGEIGTVFGCAVGLKESITAITVVALGTSLPDTFASMSAAKNADSADAAIGNITGSNSVNVFLGLGLPWALAVTVWASNPDHPKV
jgi:solute carrier family 8 (sodium/calcium exchanger)